MKPVVSVIIPVYNGEKYIERCLDSIVNQSYENIEIIIVNDGSLDGTNEKIKKYKEIDNRIVYVQQENSGVSCARNTGINKASGSYLVFVDSDDTVEKDYIKILLDTINEYDLDIVACGYNDLSVYGVNKLNDFYDSNILIHKNKFVEYIFRGVGGTLWGKIFKSQIIKSNRIVMNPQIYMCEDMIFVLEYTMKCNGFGAIKDYLYNYNRLNDSSISSKINFNYFKNMVSVMKEIENTLINNNYTIEFIDAILRERTKNLMLSLSIMQHDKKHGYSRKNKIQNFKIMFADSYVKRYKGQMVIQGTNEKVLGYLINKQMAGMACLVSRYIYGLNRLKYITKKNLNLLGGQDEAQKAYY